MNEVCEVDWSKVNWKFCAHCGAKRPEEPRKVGVEDELQQIMQKRMNDDPINAGELYSRTCAKAAIEFFKKRMPKYRSENYMTVHNRLERNIGYNECMKDFELALFGEKE